MGGGVLYGDAVNELRAFCEAHGLPIGETQAGKSAVADAHPLNMGAVGVTGTSAANALAAEAPYWIRRTAEAPADPVAAIAAYDTLESRWRHGHSTMPLPSEARARRPAPARPHKSEPSRPAARLASRPARYLSRRPTRAA